MFGIRMRNILDLAKLLDDMEKVEQDVSGTMFRKP